VDMVHSTLFWCRHGSFNFLLMWTWFVQFSSNVDMVHSTFLMLLFVRLAEKFILKEITCFSLYNSFIKSVWNLEYCLIYLSILIPNNWWAIRSSPVIYTMSFIATTEHKKTWQNFVRTKLNCDLSGTFILQEPDWPITGHELIQFL